MAWAWRAGEGGDRMPIVGVSKMRVYELAHELNRPAAIVLETAQRLGFDVRNHLMSLLPFAANLDPAGTASPTSPEH